MDERKHEETRSAGSSLNPTRSAPTNAPTGFEKPATSSGASAAGGAGMGGTGSIAGRQKGQEIAGEMKEGAVAISEKVRTNVERMAESGIHRLAEEIRSIGAASHAAADKLDEEEHERVSHYVDDLTHQFESAADYIEEKGVDGLVRDAAEVARHNPALFLGAAALAGFALGRVFSATTPRSRSGEGEAGSGGYGPDRPGSRGPSRGYGGSLFDQPATHEERRTT